MQPFPTFPKCSLFHIFNYFLYLNFNFSCNTYVAQPSISLASKFLSPYKFHNPKMLLGSPSLNATNNSWFSKILLWEICICTSCGMSHFLLIKTRTVVYFLFLFLVPFPHLYLQNLYIHKSFSPSPLNQSPMKMFLF